jgi:hypothetical protein
MDEIYSLMCKKSFVWGYIFVTLLVSVGCGQKSQQDAATQNAPKSVQNSLNDISVLQDAKDSRVYLVSQGQRHYIPDPKTLDVLGIKSQIKSASSEQINAIPLSQPIPSLSSKFIQKAGTGQVFMIEAGKRRYVPDPETLQALHVSKGDVAGINDSEAESIPLGEPLAHRAN